MAENTYEFEVRAVCPIHADLIDVYQVTIKSADTIPVETILEHFKQYEKAQIFQEALTQKAAVALGVHVTTVGLHAGVRLTCIAP